MKMKEFTMCVRNCIDFVIERSTSVLSSSGSYRDSSPQKEKFVRCENAVSNPYCPTQDTSHIYRPVHHEISPK